MSLEWRHTPNQSLSDPKALCHDNSLAVMSTVAIECILLVVDWGLEWQKACHLPMGIGHSAQMECRSVVDDGPHILGVFGAGPTSLLLWHFSRVEDCGLYTGCPRMNATLLNENNF